MKYSFWSDVLGVGFTLPINTLLMFWLYGTLKLPLPRLFGHICAVVTLLYALSLGLEITDVVLIAQKESIKASKRFWTWSGFAVSDALAVWTWANTTYFCRLLAH